MEHNDITLKYFHIFKKGTKKVRVAMLYPDGWTIEQEDFLDDYAGYPYPFSFKVRLESPDNTAALSYYSPRSYLDDHLHPYYDNTTSDYGDLYRKYTDIGTYLDNLARYYLGKYEDLRYIKEVDFLDHKNDEKWKQEALNKAKQNGEQLNWYEFNWKGRIYAYKYNGYQRVRIFSCISEARDLSVWANTQAIYGMNDPFMAQMARNIMPNYQFNPSTNSYVYTSMMETRWSVKQIVQMDCLATDYNYLYEKVYYPTIKKGVTIHKDTWDEYEALKKEYSLKNQNRRNEKKIAAENQRKQDEARRARNKELTDYVRKSQKETHDMINDSYQKRNESQRKISQMWSDTILDNTRFVDKHGNEHVVHTLDKHVYKKGDDYITSDSSLDLGYDWEELEKKKY